MEIVWIGHYIEKMFLCDDMDKRIHPYIRRDCGAYDGKEGMQSTFMKVANLSPSETGVTGTNIYVVPSNITIREMTLLI